MCDRHSRTKSGFKRVGLLTWHYYSNVGSQIQAYAMQRVVCSLGYECEFVNYRKPRLDGEAGLRIMVKRLLLPFGGILPRKYRLDSYRFRSRYFDESRKVTNLKELSALESEYDVLLCGSDQIWAPNVFDPAYMFKGAPDSIPKISYAASIGLPDIPDELVGEYRRLLTRFDSIGVREETGRRLIEEKLGLRATTVLDPSFLLGPAEWDAVALPSSVGEGEVFCYFLGNRTPYEPVVRGWEESLGAQAFVYDPSGGSEAWAARSARWMGVPEFLARIRGASIVVTDSFHGIALSINYGKDFVALKRFADGDKENQNSRVLNILGKLGLEERIIGGPCCLQAIDYGSVNERLAREREASWSFLRSSLEGVLRDA